MNRRSFFGKLFGGAAAAAAGKAATEAKPEPTVQEHRVVVGFRRDSKWEVLETISTEVVVAKEPTRAMRCGNQGAKR